MILIGLGNKARQGKNYVANYMKEQNNSIRIYSFADELKLYCKEHHDELVPRWQIFHTTKQYPVKKDDPIYGYTPILQWYGTDVARKENPNVWVEALEKRLETEKPDIAVITDVRFLNEAEFIKDRLGYLVQVIRLKDDGTQYLDAGRDPNHVSETALDSYEGWDFTIMVRDGDLESLRKKSIGVYNLATSDDWPQAYYVDEPDYSLDIVESIDSQGDGWKDPVVD